MGYVCSEPSRTSGMMGLVVLLLLGCSTCVSCSHQLSPYAQAASAVVRHVREDNAGATDMTRATISSATLTSLHGLESQFPETKTKASGMYLRWVCSDIETNHGPWLAYVTALNIIEDWLGQGD